MIKDRAWAAEMTQWEFEREWQRRYPMSDVVPDVKFWVNNGPPVYDRLIDGVEPKDALMEDRETTARLPEHLKPIENILEPKEIPEEEEKLELPEIPTKKRGPQKGRFPCRGCGQVFEYKVARAGHERACKVALNMKMEE